MESSQCDYYLYVADFGDLIKIGVTHDVKSRLNQVGYSLGRKALRHIDYKFNCIDKAEFIESLMKDEFKLYVVRGERVKTEIFSLSFEVAKESAKRLIEKGEFGIANNPRGAGRKKNTWTSRKMTVPDPIRSEVKAMIEEWIKQNK